MSGQEKTRTLVKEILGSEKYLEIVDADAENKLVPKADRTKRHRR